MEVQGTAPIQRLSLVINGREALATSSSTAEATLTHRFDPTRERPNGYCHVTVLQDDGEMAWSSPIWFGSS